MTDTTLQNSPKKNQKFSPSDSCTTACFEEIEPPTEINDVDGEWLQLAIDCGAVVVDNGPPFENKYTEMQEEILGYGYSPLESQLREGKWL